VNWLQRDFGLYLVGLFDTYFASVQLQFPAKSLAYLLLNYVDIEADKKYQLADWRIRPLPAEMLAYARSDTHYLLYIYDNLRRDLVARSKERNLLTDVLNLSRKLAMLTYRRERYDEDEGLGTDGWRKLLLNHKGPSLHSNLQVAVFKRLHRWRDQIAREEDESTNFVLPNRSLINIAATLPHSMHGVVAACNPVPPLVQVYAEDIAYLVQRTRKDLAQEAEKAEETAAKSIQVNVDTEMKNGITGSTHVWYRDDQTAPNGVRSAMEAVKHGSQFDVWGDQHDRLHSLLKETSSFYSSLEHKGDENVAKANVTGDLADIKLSVPLPPLTAQIYMTADDAKAIDAEAEETEQENIASLAEHPFVIRQKEAVQEEESQPEQVPSGSDVIIPRHLGKNRKREKPDDDDESDAKSASKKKKKSKSKQKALKERVTEVETAKPAEQFDPYNDVGKSSSSGNGDVEAYRNKPKSNKGQHSGKSMTFKTQKTR
jgi:exosome complex exonuclease RRP6